MTSIIIATSDGPRIVRDCDADDRLVAGTGDPTPVDDLEVDYDPRETGRIERLLDAAFGPLDGAR